ncbi:hypothetical protein PAMP_006613 [Pampus punctatissimus]
MFHCVLSFVETINSRRQQSPLAAKDGRTRAKKRQASPDMETPQKRKMVPKAEPCNTSQEDVSMKRLKRKIREDGEGPLQEKKRRKRVFDLQLDDKESASSSTDTGRESINSPLEGCSTSLAVKGVKRKAANDGEEPTRKKKKSPDLKETKEETKEVFTSSPRAGFEEKYQQENKLGEGGCGSVFAGYRKADRLPVAIKHIPKDKVLCKQTDKNGKQLSVEVAVMLKLRQTASKGPSAPVSLLDWYDLKQELVLVLERPVPAVDLYKYTEAHGGSLEEEEAKIILKQLLDATIELEKMCIFHRDIKVENILIETSTDVPCVRLIDFGLSCFFKKRSSYSVFYGTSAHTPPEWYDRYTYRVSPTTVWQLGVVLFETLHRNSLFETRRFLGNKLKISNKLSDVEIIAGLLYMGDQKQAMDLSINKDLKISAVISISESNTLEPLKGNQSILNIPVADSAVSHLYSSFERICSFIGKLYYYYILYF